MTTEQWKKLVGFELEEEFDYIIQMIFDLGQFKQYNSIATAMKTILKELCPELEFDYLNKLIKINNITITSEI